MNTGAITTAGGSATANNADGHDAQYIEMWGLSIDNSGNLSANGGDGGATGGNGGDGDNIFLFSWEGTHNTGTLNTSGGTGEEPGDDAWSYIDGVNVTP